MYVNPAQKFVTYAAYYTNAFARESIRDIERLTRPMPQGQAYWSEVAQRVKFVVFAVFSIPLAVALFIPSATCYLIAAAAGRGGFEFIGPKSSGQPVVPEQIDVKVVSLNANLQDPWSPFSGGTVPPFEPVADCASRIAAIVKEIAKEQPDVFLGQEMENLGAQDEFNRLMRQEGFSYFIRDLGSDEPVRNSSGTFAALKAPPKDIQFIPYPAQDRSGLAKWCRQGALACTIHGLRLVDVHLNYGDKEEDQKSRNRQLKHHVVPLLKGSPAVAFGDLNCDTSKIDRVAAGLEGFRNAFEGQTTCTDAGKHALRGKISSPGGQACTDCDERIDGLIYDPNQVEVVNSSVKQLCFGRQFLSDHFMTVATVRIRKQIY